MTGINEVAKQIHENAVEHGWRDVVGAPKHYSNTYNCMCGQCITVKYRRTWVME